MDKIITSWWKDSGSLSFEEYKEKGGFEVLEKVLKGEINNIIGQIEESGLQGRGGGGFPVGVKWRLTSQSVEKASPPFFPAESNSYFICNADESEPGTFKDRMIIEKCPFLPLEGMIIGAKAIGASKGIIYINSHYKGPAEILRRAIARMEEEGLAGENILGTDYSLELSVYEGAGSYICGEETALINSIEGNRGEPKLRPPYPVEKGLFGRPTAVNNVESLSNIPYILKEGAEKYAEIKSKAGSYGNKIYLLNGSIESPGAYEAPMGITIKQLLKDYGKGMRQGKKLRCVQVGGSSGRVYGKDDWEKPLGYSKGEIPIGSGSLLFIDTTADLKKLLYAWSGFFLRESCGKCTPCREGTYQLFRIASEVLKKGHLDKEQQEKVADLIFTMQNSCFCPLGSSAVCGWDSVIELFPKEILGKVK